VYFLKRYLATHRRIKLSHILATYNAKGSSGNIVENVEDEECHNFILLIKCSAPNKEL